MNIINLTSPLTNDSEKLNTMNKEQIIAEALKILNARPDNKKGFRHLQAVEWLKEIVIPELKSKNGR